MNEFPRSVLLIEDEPQIRRFVRTVLEDEGWLVFEASTLQRGLIESAGRAPDLVLLDLGLPDGDGVEFIVDLRKWSSVPIVVLSARVREEEKIRALDAGADDYLTKPFGVGELLARVRATIRRYGQSASTDVKIVKFGDVTVSLQDRRVTKAGEKVHLTPTEYKLLSVIVANAGRVMTNQQLLREVWGPRHVERRHYLHVYMGHLRNKLEDVPTQPRYFITQTAVGYRLLLPD